VPFYNAVAWIAEKRSSIVADVRNDVSIKRGEIRYRKRPLVDPPLPSVLPTPQGFPTWSAEAQRG